MDLEKLETYINMIDNLHRNKSRGEYAPHKPVLLITLIDAIARGMITSNLVRITPELVALFRSYFQALVKADSWKERIVYPFRYLIHDGFWELVKDDKSLSVEQLGDPTSINGLIKIIDGGKFATDLWELLQDGMVRDILRNHILKTYFDIEESDLAGRIPTDSIDYEVKKLMEDAKGKFRKKVIRDGNKEDMYFIRSSLFPEIVKKLYNNSCAVCGLRTCLDDDRGIVDCAHILPFRDFHNDDPRNGIALCKNHHWGFDHGWFTINNSYKIAKSPHLIDDQSYVKHGAYINLPNRIEYAPALSAITWHRFNIFLK